MWLDSQLSTGLPVSTVSDLFWVTVRSKEKQHTLTRIVLHVSTNNIRAQPGTAEQDREHDNHAMHQQQKMSSVDGGHPPVQRSDGAADALLNASTQGAPSIQSLPSNSLRTSYAAVNSDETLEMSLSTQAISEDTLIHRSAFRADDEPVEQPALSSLPPSSAIEEDEDEGDTPPPPSPPRKTAAAGASAHFVPTTLSGIGDMASEPILPLSSSFTQGTQSYTDAIHEQEMVYTQDPRFAGGATANLSQPHRHSPQAAAESPLSSPSSPLPSSSSSTTTPAPNNTSSQVIPAAAGGNVDTSVSRSDTIAARPIHVRGLSIAKKGQAKALKGRQGSRAALDDFGSDSDDQSSIGASTSSPNLSNIVSTQPQRGTSSSTHFSLSSNEAASSTLPVQSVLSSSLSHEATISSDRKIELPAEVAATSQLIADPVLSTPSSRRQESVSGHADVPAHRGDVAQDLLPTNGSALERIEHPSSGLPSSEAETMPASTFPGMQADTVPSGSSEDIALGENTEETARSTALASAPSTLSKTRNNGKGLTPLENRSIAGSSYNRRVGKPAIKAISAKHVAGSTVFMQEDSCNSPVSIPLEGGGSLPSGEVPAPVPTARSPDPHAHHPLINDIPTEPVCVTRRAKYG